MPVPVSQAPLTESFKMGKAMVGTINVEIATELIESGFSLNSQDEDCLRDGEAV